MPGHFLVWLINSYAVMISKYRPSKLTFRIDGNPQSITVAIDSKPVERVGAHHVDKLDRCRYT
jgi:hypothetical protein